MKKRILPARLPGRNPGQVNAQTKRETSHALVDTGPLVAIFLTSDPNHSDCVEALHSLPWPLLSCWPVITEALWLLRADPEACRKLLGAIGTEFLHLLPLLPADGPAISQVMEQYQSHGPQFTDSTLVLLALREHIDTIFTTDPNSFSFYRISRKRPFRLIPTPEKPRRKKH